MEQPDAQIAETSLAFLQQTDKRVAEAVMSCPLLLTYMLTHVQLRPMHEQMQSFKSELGRLKAQVSEMDSLSARVTNLTTQVETLKRRADQTSRLEREIQLLKNPESTEGPVTSEGNLKDSVNG
jgi:hypothetical protein